MRLHNIKKSYEIKNYNDRNVDSYMQFLERISLNIYQIIH